MSGILNRASGHDIGLEVEDAPTDAAEVADTKRALVVQVERMAADDSVLWRKSTVEALEKEPGA
eukprot:7220108-Prymnesium_polylepis.1